MKPKIIAIVGPTASGKSELAVHLAKKFNGEIVSADSRQIYIGLNIGSGKITKKEMHGIKHHLLDVVNPKRIYSVSKYQSEAQKILRQIFKRNKIPIICGGTGFYVDSLIYNTLLPQVSPNYKLRKALNKKSAIQLFVMLKSKDPKRASKIDSKNKVRLIRALEIVSQIGKVPPITHSSPYNPLLIGLKLREEELKKKIHSRLILRIKKGMISEVKKLHKNGLSWKRMEELGLEYKFVALFLQKKISKAQMLRLLETAIWQYSRRQMTWFRKNKKISWFDIGNKFFKLKIEKIVKKFLI